MCSDQVAVFLRVGHFEAKVVADQIAGIADLAARFAVERRAVEHHRDRLSWPTSSIWSHSFIVGDDPR